MRRVVLALALLGLVAASAAQAANPVVAAAKRSTTARSSVVDLRIETVAAGSRTTMTGSGAVRGTDVKMSMRIGAGGTAVGIDMIMLREAAGYVMYMRSPMLGSQLPAGKEWLRVDLQKEGAKLGLDLGSLVDSTQTLAPLQHGLVSTTRLGRETVAGKRATHYRAVIDVRRAAAAVPAYGKQVAAVERATGVRLGRLVENVWIGADGRISRVRISMPTVVQGTRATSVQTMTFRAYDVPVSITPPPAAQVYSP